MQIGKALSKKCTKKAAKGVAATQFHTAMTFITLMNEFLSLFLLFARRISQPKLIRKYGYPSETHTVVTKDGYILEMHRIPKKGAQPVLLMHGILDTSATWVLMGPKSGLGECEKPKLWPKRRVIHSIILPGYMLSDLGYDVWMGNSRGNRYSKNHTILNSDYQEFWDFTFHEMGKYDLPANIDYILSKTGYEQLHYIGHSQGTAIFWVLCSEQPAYSQKITSMHALAPIAYIHDMKSPLFRTLVLFLDFLTVSEVFLVAFPSPFYSVSTLFFVDRLPRECCASPNSCPTPNSWWTTARLCATTTQ